MIEESGIVKNFYILKKEIDSVLIAFQCKGTHLQNYLYFIYAPVFNYTDSIIVLCNNGKYNAASALLRSLIEAHINIIYHQLNDSEHKLAVSAKAEFDDKLKGIRELKKLIKKYPNLESTDPKKLFSQEWLDEAEKWAVVQHKAILKGNNLKKEEPLDLKSKAIKCDQANLKNTEGGSFERIYNIIYRQLSPFVHLDISGLESFAEKDENGKYVFKDSYEGEMLISQAIDISIALTKDLFDNKVIEGKIPGIVYTLEKLLATK